MKTFAPALLALAVFAGPALLGLAAHAAPPTASPATPPTLRLCTGRDGGLHHRIGATLRAALAGKVDVALVTGRGSAEAVDRMIGPTRACDATIAQEDIGALHALARPGEALAIDRVVSLYPEHVYLLCNPAVKATTLTGLDPTTDRVYLRPAHAGSHATWRLFGRLAPRYATIPVVEFEQSTEAVERLAQNTEPACLFFVSGVDSARLTAADREHPALRLLPVVDRELHRPVGPHKRQIFAPSTITAARWPHLLAADLDTQSVDAVFYVARDWKTAHPAAAAALTAALVQIVPTLGGP